MCSTKIICELTGTHKNVFIDDMTWHVVYDMAQQNKLIKQDRGFNGGFHN